MQHIGWLLTYTLISVIGQKDLINIQKHKYQSNNRYAVFVLIFFSPCDYNNYI